MGIDRILKYVVFTFCGIALMFAFSLVFIPSFDDSKALLVGGIMGALVTMATTLATMSRLTTLDRKDESHANRGNNAP